MKRAAVSLAPSLHVVSSVLIMQRDPLSDLRNESPYLFYLGGGPRYDAGFVAIEPHRVPLVIAR